MSFIEDAEKKYDFNDYLKNIIDESDFKKAIKQKKVKEYLQGINEEWQLTDKQVIFYSTAIDYLKENDPSLKISLELAKDCWFSLDSLNSELLASLLATDNAKDDYETFISEIIDFIW